MTVTITWRGPEFVKFVRSEVNSLLGAAGELVVADILRSIRNPWPPASSPGEPPHTRRFQQGLLGSIFSEVDRNAMVAVVGSTMKHSLFLELGTRFMQARPFMLPALENAIPKINRMFASHAPKGGRRRDAKGRFI